MSAQRNRYDAFISYSQRDGGTAGWLQPLLADYWIPGKKRRAIFLDRTSMAAGVLNDEIRQALRESRFLIVCCSQEARDSKCVDVEVEEFLATHPPERVLACIVGPENAWVLPHSIERLEAARGELLKPDLRGYLEQKPRKEQRAAQEYATALLAPLLGFPGKDALLDEVMKRRAF